MPRANAAVRVASAAAGLALLAGSLLPGLRRKRDPLAAHDCIEIAAPPGRVYEFLRDFQNYPRFLEYVQRIDVSTEGRARWMLGGGGPLAIELNTEVTREIPGRVLTWRSASGSQLGHHGGLVVEALGGDRARVTLRLAYETPGPAMEQAVRTALGGTARQAVRRALERMKAQIETGSAAGGTVRRSVDLPPGPAPQ